MKYSRTLVTILVFILNIAVSQLALAEETPAAQLQTRLSNIKTMQANFKQVVSDPNEGVLQRASGNMALQRPNHFRWYTKSPTKQLILTDGKNIWIYDIDLEQATVQPLEKIGGNTPAMLMSGSTEKIVENFIINIEKDSDGKQWFVLIPKQKSNFFQTVRLNFSAGKLQRMEFTDDLGQITQIKFTNAKINSQLSSKLFKFSPPRGVDVIGKES